MNKVRVLSSSGAVTANVVVGVGGGGSGGGSGGHDQQALSRFDAQRVVQQLSQDDDRAGLLALYDLATGAEAHTPRGLKSGEMFSVVDSAVRSGRIVFTRGWDFGDLQGLVGREQASSATAALARAVMVMAGRSDLPFEGQRYRLVDADVTSGTHAEDDFRPVAAAEAADLFKRMTDKIPITPEQRARWTEALALVTAPVKGHGLRLLRYTPARISEIAPPAAPAAPPRSRQDSAPSHWIELEIVYEDGTPFTGNCVVTLPNGKVTEGPPGEGGLLCLDGLTGGTCKVSFPELDAATFKPA
jgi:hypothetical protein